MKTQLSPLTPHLFGFPLANFAGFHWVFFISLGMLFFQRKCMLISQGKFQRGADEIRARHRQRTRYPVYFCEQGFVYRKFYGGHGYLNFTDLIDNDLVSHR